MISISPLINKTMYKKQNKKNVNRIKYKFSTTQNNFNLHMVSDLQKYTIVF